MREQQPDPAAVDRSRGHGVGTDKPWVRGFSPTAPGASFHPTGAGMRAVAAAVMDHLSEQW